MAESDKFEAGRSTPEAASPRLADKLKKNADKREKIVENTRAATDKTKKSLEDKMEDTLRAEGLSWDNEKEQIVAIRYLAKKGSKNNPRAQQIARAYLREKCLKPIGNKGYMFVGKGEYYNCTLGELFGREKITVLKGRRLVQLNRNPNGEFSRPGRNSKESIGTNHIVFAGTSAENVKKMLTQRRNNNILAYYIKRNKVGAIRRWARGSDTNRSRMASQYLRNACVKDIDDKPTFTPLRAKDRALYNVTLTELYPRSKRILVIRNGESLLGEREGRNFVYKKSVRGREVKVRLGVRTGDVVRIPPPRLHALAPIAKKSERSVAPAPTKKKPPRLVNIEPPPTLPTKAKKSGVAKKAATVVPAAPAKREPKLAAAQKAKIIAETKAANNREVPSPPPRMAPPEQKVVQPKLGAKDKVKLFMAKLNASFKKEALKGLKPKDIVEILVGKLNGKKNTKEKIALLNNFDSEDLYLLVTKGAIDGIVYEKGIFEGSFNTVFALLMKSLVKEGKDATYLLKKYPAESIHFLTQCTRFGKLSALLSTIKNPIEKGKTAKRAIDNLEKIFSISMYSDNVVADLIKMKPDALRKEVEEMIVDKYTSIMDLGEKKGRNKAIFFTIAAKYAPHLISTNPDTKEIYAKIAERYKYRNKILADLKKFKTYKPDDTEHDGEYLRTEKALTNFHLDLADGALYKKSRRERFGIYEKYSAKELFTLLALGKGGDLLYTSTFLTIFGMMLKKMKKVGIDGQTLLKSLPDERSKFIKMCFQFDRFKLFLNTIKSTERKKNMLDSFVKDMNQTDIYNYASSITEMLGAVRNNPDLQKHLEKTLRDEYMKQGENSKIKLLLGLVAANHGEKAISNREWFKKMYQNYNPYLPKQSRMETKDVFDKNGLCVQRHFYYNDKDGVSSFKSFISKSKSKRWKIKYSEGKKYAILTKTAGNKKIMIFANVPKVMKDDEEAASASEDAQNKIEEFIKKNNLKTGVVVHRGHSYHSDLTAKRIPKDVKLVVWGGCGFYKNFMQVLKKTKNLRYLVSTRRLGTTNVNNTLISQINNGLLRNRVINWKSLWKSSKRKLARRIDRYRLTGYMRPDKHLGVTYYLAHQAYKKGVMAPITVASAM
ncbi:hypothetical protein KKG71_01270 [Patescibacteria group bacterium]|nr:hypothetical protein [Patescibacteria group bacterium]